MSRQTIFESPVHEAVCEALESLVRERPEKTCELFTPNDFYGHATLLKHYAGLPAGIPLLGVLPHGPSINHTIWQPELDSPVPNIFAISEEQKVCYQKASSKPVFVIGSVVHYAAEIISQELEVARQCAEGTVAFPAHSTHHLTCEFDQHQFIEALQTLPDSMGPVRVCLYWRDVQLKRHLKYLQAGFECVTAGHMFDPDFCFRLLKIFSQSKFAITNKMGSSALLAASLGLEVAYIDQTTRIRGTNEKFEGEAAPTVDQPSAMALFESMKIPLGQPRPNQRNWGDIATGRAFVRSPEQLREMMVEHAKSMIEKPAIKPSLRTWDQEMGRIKQAANTSLDRTDGTLLPDGNVFHFMNQHRLLEDHEIWGIEGLCPAFNADDAPVIVDCGSDTGYTIIRMAQAWPKAQIYGFEANPLKTKMLYRNLDAMGLRHVSVGGKAVWIESGKVAFETSEPGLGSQVCQIGCIRLKDFLQQTSVGLLRLNIANAILPVVQDCGEVLRQARHIVLNYPSESSNRDELIALMAELSALGYQLQIKQARPLAGSESNLRIVLTATILR
jgi:FkbM family methyltransferase